MVGDDLEADVAGAQRFGLRTALVRTGKFRLDGLERSSVGPDVVLSSGRRPPVLARGVAVTRVRDGHDRDPAHPRGARAVRGLQGPLLHGRGAGLLRGGRPNPAQHYAARFAGKEAVGKALGFGVARLFAWRDIEIAGRPKPSVRLSGRVEAWSRRVDAGAIDSRCLTRASSRVRSAWSPTQMVGFEPLYTAAEMKAAEEGHDVEELMERAGRAVADEILTRFAAARSFAAVCGGGANGGDGRIAAEFLRSSGWEERPVGDADVVIDALFGPVSTARRGRKRRSRSGR